MRKLSEIQDDLKAIEQQMAELKEKRNKVLAERAEVLFAEFSKKYGLKKGDIVSTVRHGKMVLCGGMVSNWSEWVKVRQIKINGEYYAKTTGKPTYAFDDCTIIGHTSEDL